MYTRTRFAEYEIPHGVIANKPRRIYLKRIKVLNRITTLKEFNGSYYSYFYEECLSLRNADVVIVPVSKLESITRTLDSYGFRYCAAEPDGSGFVHIDVLEKC